MSNNFVAEDFVTPKNVQTFDVGSFMDKFLKDKPDYKKYHFYDKEILHGLLCDLVGHPPIKEMFSDDNFYFNVKDAKIVDIFKTIEFEDYLTEVWFPQELNNFVLVMRPKPEYEEISTENLIEHEIGDVVNLQLTKVKDGDIEFDGDLDPEKNVFKEGTKVKINPDGVSSTFTDFYFRGIVESVTDNKKIDMLKVLGTGSLSDGKFAYEDKAQRVRLIHMGLVSAPCGDGISKWESYIIPHNGGENTSVITGTLARCLRPKPFSKGGEK